MPLKSKTGKGRKVGARRFKGRRRGGVPRLVNNSQMAKVVEYLPETVLSANTPTRITISGLLASVRAEQVGRQYAFYRISKILMKIKPVYDTYSPGIAPTGSNPGAVPYFFYSMVRDGDYAAAPTTHYFEQRGSKPIRLDDKIVNVGWKPNVLIQTDSGLAGLQTNIKMTPWLSCDSSNGAAWNPSAVPHHGLIMAAYAAAGGSGNGVVAKVSVEIHYEFKGAHAQVSTTEGDVSTVDLLAPVSKAEPVYDVSGNEI